MGWDWEMALPKEPTKWTGWGRTLTGAVDDNAIELGTGVCKRIAVVGAADI